MRGAGGVIAGLLAGVIVMMLVAFVGGTIFPMEAQVDPYSAREVTAAFGSASMAAKITVLLSWFLGAFAGAAVAKLVGRARWAAWVVAIIFTVYVTASVFVLPMPEWMQILAVALPLIAGYTAARMRLGRAAAEPRDAGLADSEVG